jgi:hypothetical protein
MIWKQAATWGNAPASVFRTHPYMTCHSPQKYADPSIRQLVAANTLREKAYAALGATVASLD